MEVREFKAKTVDEAITAATLELGISSDQLEYKVIDEGSKGFLGIYNTLHLLCCLSFKNNHSVNSKIGCLKIPVRIFKHP